MNTITQQPVVYISGKMTGEPEFGKPAFEEAERKLTALGYRVLNPAWMPDGMSYEDYMRNGINLVFSADIIVLLPNWKKSKGAVAECALAYCLDKKCIELDEIIELKEQMEA